MKIMIRCTTLQPCVYLPGNRHGFLSTTTTTATASAVRREGALDDAAPLEVIQSAHEATLHHRRLVQQLIIAGLPLLGITAAGLIVVVGLIVVRPVGDCSVQLVFAVIGLIQAEQEEVEPFPRELLIRGMHHLVAQDKGVWKEVRCICRASAFTATTGSIMVDGCVDLRY